MLRLAHVVCGLVISGLLFIVPTACTGSSNGNGQPATSTCTAARAHVESLYRAESGKSGDQADIEESVADNTDMMLEDCRRDPKRFAPCLQAAVSVQQMERDCLIPLDDEGSVEGRTFNRNNPAANPL